MDMETKPKEKLTAPPWSRILAYFFDCSLILLPILLVNQLEKLEWTFALLFCLYQTVSAGVLGKGKSLGYRLFGAEIHRRGGGWLSYYRAFVRSIFHALPVFLGLYAYRTCETDYYFLAWGLLLTNTYLLLLHPRSQTVGDLVSRAVVLKPKTPSMQVVHLRRSSHLKIWAGLTLTLILSVWTGHYIFTKRGISDRWCLVFKN